MCGIWVIKTSTYILVITARNLIGVRFATRNEEERIELSLLSIKHFADEIVVVNNIPYFKIGKVMVRKLELALNVLT